MRLSGPYKPVRGLNIGKAFYVKERRGRLYACKWPRKRQRVKHPTTLAQMEKFRQANWLAKYAPAPIQMAHRQMVEGTQLLPRDLMVAAMFGRGFTWAIPGHRRRYPVAAVRDLSDNLDILGPNVGGILTRGADRWEAPAAAQAGQILVAQAPGTPAAWETLTLGTPFWGQLADVTLPAPLAVGVYQQVSIPSNAQELEFTIYIPAVAGGIVPTARINADAGNNYAYGHVGVTQAGASVVAAGSNPSFIRLSANVSGFITQALSARGRVFQPVPSGRAFFEAETAYSGGGMLAIRGSWAFAGTPNISQLGFASFSGNGLPAGTRIIVRAILL